ncbi:MAG: putative bifunctional diguanylate cyclase/phosphodiesterase [Rubrivivax sp.]
MFLDAFPLVKSTSEVADLNEIFDRIGEAIVLVDGDWRVRYVNDVYLRISGLSRAGVEGRITFDFAPNFRQSIFFESIERAIEEGRETRKVSFSPVLRQWMRVRAVPYDNGAAVFMRTASEDSVTEHLRAESAATDPVTGLRNKLGMEDHAKELLKKRAPFHLMIIGIDGLKTATDNYGYTVGDMCILELAALMRVSLSEGDSLYRITSDEFAAICFGTEEEVIEKAHSFRSAVERPITLPATRVILSASIGVTNSTAHGYDFENLLKRCSLALTHVRRDRIDRSSRFIPIRVFQSEMELAANHRMRLQEELRNSLDGRDFELHIQPKVSLASGTVVGGEALLRWRHPARGLLTPGAFLEIAEETGAMPAIDDWVLKTAVGAARTLEAQGLLVPISVNLGVDSLDDPQLSAKLGLFLREKNLSPWMLEVEIPEGALMHDVDRAISTLTELHMMGVKLSIDDFGTGYSSFAYLAEFPVHTLKIDRSFIIELKNSRAKRTIVQSIIRLAHHLSLDVVAEGAEDNDQVNMLRKMNCDKLQGYAIAKPLTLDKFIDFVKLNSRESDQDPYTI